jgi:DNase/tRNase domain of colicin-like bacteriocin
LQHFSDKIIINKEIAMPKKSSYSRRRGKNRKKMHPLTALLIIGLFAFGSIYNSLNPDLGVSTYEEVDIDSQDIQNPLDDTTQDDASVAPTPAPTRQPDAPKASAGSAVNRQQVKHLPSRNQKLEGSTHPVTNVPYTRVVVQLVDSSYVSIVVPQFESYFSVVLPKNLLTETDTKQFSYCNKALRDAVNRNAQLAGRFSSEQLAQIKAGKRPKGFTWHHDAPVGQMHLVQSTPHQKSAHTGGRSLWGGGSDAR